MNDCSIDEKESKAKTPVHKTQRAVQSPAVQPSATPAMQRVAPVVKQAQGNKRQRTSGQEQREFVGNRAVIIAQFKALMKYMGLTGQTHILVKPIGTAAFKVSTNGGNWNALQVYSTGLDNSNANVIGYAAILQPLSSGRFVTPSFSTVPTGAALGEIYMDTSGGGFKPSAYNGSTWKQFIVNDDYPIRPYTNTSMKINTAIYRITSSLGVITYNLLTGSNLALGTNAYVSEIAFDVDYVTLPTNFYSWSIAISNNDMATTIMHGKFVNNGGPYTTSNKLKLFDGAGNELTTLNDSTYYVSVTIFTN
ncbi:hypothetical protein Catovirus_1_82 [Catovirus CTV1]|uniref:Uncharacterized protein n=1 Tax=Catovirus CTV1 TaxID=1977631 RepID=A0A1V0S8K2_9VIRU|nr:hypothetical protein Catovirus_1_82 [Catovirus CTV1]